ncbi:MAG: sigma-70 family RNA polymerase sigma factor [Acidobacteria bacterium]|nr:sigma-70 family RNA polymerase sigma factor [Acidobacteriota bacterium]
MFGLATTRPADAEERTFIAELQVGSEEAYNRLIALYAPSVYRVAYRLLNNPADASDTAQEVFLRVFRGIGHFQNNCSLKTWIYRITVNAVSNQNRWWHRHRVNELSLDSPDNSPVAASLRQSDRSWDPLESVLSQETQELVQTALLRLPESARALLILREMEGLSYEEVGDILHVSLGTVKSRLARARLALKTELEALLAPAPGPVPVWSHAD